MYRLFLFTGFVVFYMAVVSNAATIVKIVNGNDADIEEFPWQVSVQVNDNGYWESHCGGVIIDKNWVLTAAHCTFSSVTRTRERFRVLAGSSLYSQLNVTRYVKDIYVHKNFQKPEVLDNDIMLIELKKPLIFGSTINKISLDGDISKNRTGELCKVSGWGNTNGTKDELNKLDRLQEASVQIINPDSCIKVYQHVYSVLANTKVCVQGEEKSSCGGDSGGGLVCRDVDGSTEKLVGLVSTGFGCDAKVPSIYSKVSAYLDWITTTMDKKGKNGKNNTKDKKNNKNNRDNKNRKDNKDNKNNRDNPNRKDKKNKKNKNQ
ncbi:venom peptide isomerase heavy chain-like [Mytilus edulis]|uniref:venom peptide isomerase heavy chain-like n=1 Tax=Mytilus edulis TaxID=6550 RepID=UPI0039EFC944